MSLALHIITGLNDGGAEAALFRLCTYDNKKKHHVVSLTDKGKYGPLFTEKGVTVTCLNIPRGSITVGALIHLWILILREKPSVIQTWMYHADLIGGLVARLTGHRNIVWGIRNTTLLPGENTRGTIWVARFCARLSWVVPRQILCCAEKARDAHIALGYDARRMRVVPNGYDLALYQPDTTAGRAVREELGISSEQPVIGFVARYDIVKDHATLLRALSLLNTRGEMPLCLLIGSGMDDSNVFLAGLIASLGISEKVRLLGRRTDVPAVMNALDLHVLSSSSEAFPNVLAEAMACGTPCVSTDAGDARLILGDTGWIVPPRDPEALSASLAIAIIECRKPTWSNRKKAVRHRMESLFTIERMVQRYHEVWRS